MNKNAKEIDELLNKYKGAKAAIMRDTAAMALAFFKQSFINQGFTDVSLKKWDNRIGGPRNQGRALLMNKGVLKRGLRIKKVSYEGSVVGVDDAIKYAEIQNQGGEIPVTPKMRRFFWAMYYKSGGADKKTQNTELALFWRNLALTKKNITIPQRQFIGDSQVLENKLLAYVEQELSKVLM